MLKIEMDKGRERMEVSGEVKTVVTELAVAVGKMYNILLGNSEEAANEFRTAVTIALLPDSPVWRKRDVAGAEKLECVVINEGRVKEARE